MNTKLIIRVLLLLGMLQAGAGLTRADIYYCLTWESNYRTIVDVDANNRARCVGCGQVRIATVSAQPYESVDMDQYTGFVTSTYLVDYSDWDTYLYQNYNYANRYRTMYFLPYLQSAFSCAWACPTPYNDIESVVPWFDWETHGGLPYTASSSFSGSYYFY